MRCVHVPRHWVLLHGLYIRIPHQLTHMTACFVTLVLIGRNFTSIAWLSRTRLCTSTPTGCTIGYCGLGLAVHWIQSVLHPLEHRLVDSCIFVDKLITIQSIMFFFKSRHLGLIIISDFVSCVCTRYDAIGFVRRSHTVAVALRSSHSIKVGLLNKMKAVCKCLLLQLHNF